MILFSINKILSVPIGLKSIVHNPFNYLLKILGSEQMMKSATRIKGVEEEVLESKLQNHLFSDSLTYFCISKIEVIKSN